MSLLLPGPRAPRVSILAVSLPQFLPSPNKEAPPLPSSPLESRQAFLLLLLLLWSSCSELLTLLPQFTHSVQTPKAQLPSVSSPFKKGVQVQQMAAALDVAKLLPD